MAAQVRGATTTVRSTREGEDRLYVRGSDGRRIGWFDLGTGTTQVVDPDPGAAAEVQAALDAYAAATSPLRRRRAVCGLARTVPAPRRSGEGQGDLAPEDLRERAPGERAARRVLDRAGTRALVPARGWTLSVRDPLGPALRLAHRTALGQQQVGVVLAGLGTSWHVVHDVPTTDGEWLDHLLIGPGGVVALRTAATPGAVVRVAGEVARADGRPVSDVRLVRRQARTVAARLRGVASPVAVRGVVVVVGARAVRLRDLPAGVAVVRFQDLPRWLRDLPTVLSQVDVSRLGETAARGATWHVESGVAAGRGERQARREQDRVELDRLTARARRAARVRRAAQSVALGCVTAVSLVLLQVLRPGLLPATVVATGSTLVGMIGG